MSLFQAVTNAIYASAESEVSKPQAKELFSSGDAELLFKGADVAVIVLNTVEAAKYFSKGTQWDTVEERTFGAYSKNGPLYVVITPTGKYQFSVAHKIYMDKKNKSVDLDSFLEENPEVAKAFEEKSINLVTASFKKQR